MINKKMPARYLNGVLSVWMVCCLASANLFAQDSAVAEKSKVMIGVEFFNWNSDSFFVKVSANYKLDGKLTSIEDMPVKLYFNEADEANLLGTAITSPLGDRNIFLPKSFQAQIDTLSSFDLVAETEENDRFKSGSGSMTVEHVFIDLTTEVVDSTRMMKAFVYKKEGGNKVPVSEAELRFYVKRHFGLFPLSEDNLTTDSTGMVEMEYIDSLPADTLGNLYIAAKLADLETYGNVVSTSQTNWGKKLELTYSTESALWASRSNVPLWLLFLANGIIIGVWLTIMYIVYSVYEISKLGKKQS